jgi:hypothetical protein
MTSGTPAKAPYEADEQEYREYHQRHKRQAAAEQSSAKATLSRSRLSEGANAPRPDVRSLPLVKASPMAVARKTAYAIRTTGHEVSGSRSLPTQLLRAVTADGHLASSPRIPTPASPWRSRHPQTNRASYLPALLVIGESDSAWWSSTVTHDIRHRCTNPSDRRAIGFAGQLRPSPTVRQAGPGTGGTALLQEQPPEWCRMAKQRMTSVPATRLPPKVDSVQPE